jgi:hypothetical protein
VGLRAGVDVMATRKILLCQELNPGHPAHSLVTILAGTVVYRRVNKFSVASIIEMLSLCFQRHFISFFT